MRTFLLLLTMSSVTATACVAGIQVGNDGNGGASSASTTSTTTGTTTPSTSGAGGSHPVSTCKMPAVPQCAWGYPAGPCGGGLPGSKDCYAGYVCVGESPGTPGTCVTNTDGGNTFGSVLQVPGGPCGTAGADPTLVCPWNYQCTAALGNVPRTGVCVPGSCVLGDGTPPASGASITIDGDGPTQSFAYGSVPETYQGMLTGEASAVQTFVNDAGVQGLLITGARDPSGVIPLGYLQLQVPALAAGPVEGWTNVDYFPSWDPWTDGGYPVDYISQAGIDVGAPNVTLTEVDDTHVSGTFDVPLVGDPSPLFGPKHITGSFDVCRLPASYPQ